MTGALYGRVDLECGHSKEVIYPGRPGYDFVWCFRCDKPSRIVATYPMTARDYLSHNN